MSSIPLKNIYKSDDAPLLAHLATYRSALTEEFMAQHAHEWEAPVIDLPMIYIPSIPGKKTEFAGTPEFVSKMGAWKVDFFRYESAPNDSVIVYEEKRQKYPTAFKIMEEFKDEVGICCYSVVEPNSAIQRHTGQENRMNDYLRIQVPLIVPEGDLFMEVGGEETDWSEPFAFDNQIVHSVYNNTPYRRLVFIIDIKRSRLGLPQGKPYSREAESNFPPFIRKKDVA